MKIPKPQNPDVSHKPRSLLLTFCSVKGAILRQMVKVIINFMGP